MLVPASQDALRHLEIVMVGTKFPENIGMAARACANMGCGRLTLVAPAWWDKEKARPLATAKGEALLDAVEVKETLAEALAPHVLTVGTGGGADCSRPNVRRKKSRPCCTRETASPSSSAVRTGASATPTSNSASGS